MTKRPRRRDLMEQELLRGAAELFARKGFGGTTLRDIAETAGVGRTTLYHYFASKDELLAALAEDQTTRSYEDLRELRANPELTPVEKLSRAVNVLALRVLEQPMRFRVVEREEASLPDELAREQKNIRRAALQELVTIIESGVAAGQLRAVDARLAGLSIFGMCNWPAWWFNPAGPKSAAEVAAEISSFALSALVQAGTPPKDNPAGIVDGIKADLDRLSRMIAAPS